MPVDDVVEYNVVQLVIHLEAVEHDAAAVRQAPDILVQRRLGQVCQPRGLPAVDDFEKNEQRRKLAAEKL